MSTPVAYRSQFDPSVTVYVDPWSVNPLLDDAMQAIPATVNLATASNGDPPTMFDSGDLPPFTASGVDPAALRMLPWKGRHAAAGHSSAGIVLHWVEQYGHDADTAEMEPAFDVPGRADYIARFRDWLAGRWTNPNFPGATPEQLQAAEGDLFGALFGDQITREQARIAAVNAANPPRSVAAATPLKAAQ